MICPHEGSMKYTVRVHRQAHQVFDKIKACTPDGLEVALQLEGLAFNCYFCY